LFGATFTSRKRISKQEVNMVVVPLAKPADEVRASTSSQSDETAKWIRYVAAGTLAASGAMLVTGRRKAALLAALSGTALALIDQQDAVRVWWDQLPGFLDEMHDLLGKAQTAVDDVSAQGQKLREVLHR
jgi:hypothetical protein